MRLSVLGTHQHLQAIARYHNHTFNKKAVGLYPTAFFIVHKIRGLLHEELPSEGLYLLTLELAHVEVVEKAPLI